MNSNALRNDNPLVTSTAKPIGQVSDHLALPKEWVKGRYTRWMGLWWMLLGVVTKPNQLLCGGGESTIEPYVIKLLFKMKR